MWLQRQTLHWIEHNFTGKEQRFFFQSKKKRRRLYFPRPFFVCVNSPLFFLYRFFVWKLNSLVQVSISIDLFIDSCARAEWTSPYPSPKALAINWLLRPANTPSSFKPICWEAVSLTERSHRTFCFTSCQDRTSIQLDVLCFVVVVIHVIVLFFHLKKYFPYQSGLKNPETARSASKCFKTWTRETSTTKNKQQF